MINSKMIYRITGFLLLIETAMLLCCGGVSLLYHEDDLISFLQSASLTALMGVVLLFIGRGAEKQLGRRDGYVIVTVAWLAFSLFGMLPFYLSGYIPSITNAFFETMSGFSSTGATILNDIEKLPHGLLFWRSMTQWIGGLGIVFFTIAVLPIFGVGGIQVFAAEASGPTHDKVHPRIGITAKWIWGIYAGLTGTLIILLMFGGMNIFDSICHAFATTSTGGFSTKQASIEYYHSPYIEYVISIFMFISGINFTLLLLFVNGKLKKFVHDAELKWYFWSVTGFTIVIAAILYYNSSMGVEEAFRKSLFQVASLHTSTGFATADYMTWPAITWGMLTVIMIMRRNLSGGQRQRLTIARALVRKPEILILDDSASALDFATDAALRKALRALPERPTVVIVSQRTSSIRHADQIIVLDNGHMVGLGTHEELLRTCEVYREIHESQYKKEER